MIYLILLSGNSAEDSWRNCHLMQPATFTDWSERCVIQTLCCMTVCWAAKSITHVFCFVFFLIIIIAEKASAILFPLPPAECGSHTRSCGGHTRSCSGGVFVLLLCVSPGARTRCGPFSAIVQLHSAASWLTGSKLINKKKNAPIVDLCSLLQVCPSSHVINIEMNLCQYYTIKLFYEISFVAGWLP